MLAFNTPGDRPDPWERQEGEKSVEFNAFIRFREQGLTRSRGRVAVELGKSVGWVSELARRWDWELRAQAWDDEMDRVWLMERRDAQRQAARRHSHIAEMMLDAVESKLSTILLDANGGEGITLAPADLVRWAEAAVKIERLAIGSPTEGIGPTRHGGNHLPGTALPAVPDGELTRAVIDDPEIREMALDLLERIALEGA